MATNEKGQPTGRATAGQMEACAPQSFNPLAIVAYAGQIDAAVTELFQAGLPALVIADRCLHAVIDGLRAGESASRVAADLVAKWRAGELAG